MKEFGGEKTWTAMFVISNSTRFDGRNLSSPQKIKVASVGENEYFEEEYLEQEFEERLQRVWVIHKETDVEEKHTVDYSRGDKKK